MPNPTASQRLADLALGRPLAEFVAEQRANGMAWRRIARELADATDGVVEVSGESLRSWYCDEVEPASIPTEAA